MAYRIALLILLALLVRCGQNVFPSGDLNPIKQPQPTDAGYKLVFQEVMEFNEGRLAEYTIVPTVPAPGTPVVSVSQLPAGANLLLDSPMRISWVPPLGSGINPNDPGAHFMTYRAQVTLTSSADSGISQKRTIVLLVHQATSTR